jgi:hypothetical protein
MKAQLQVFPHIDGDRGGKTAGGHPKFGGQGSATYIGAGR